MNKLTALIATAGLIAMLSGCASSSYSTLESPETTTEEESQLFIPAGVDSTTAADAEKVADDSFVSFQEEQRAIAAKEQASAYRASSDTLWYYLSLTERDNHQITEEDSIRAIQTFNEGAEFFIEMNSLNQRPGLSQAELKRQHLQLVNNAMNRMEESLTLNPFDSDTRFRLAQLYNIKAARMNDVRDYEQAIDVLEKLVRIERGDAVIYEVLADNYTGVGNYQLAAENFSKAKETIKETARLSDYYFENNAYSEQDSLDIHLYSYYEGDSFVNVYSANEALRAFEEAKEWAPTEEDRQFAQSEIDFVNWDNGNIRASMARDSLVALERNEQLQQAESGYLSLLTRLRSQTATDEIDWRLSVVQYQNGKEEPAADRLMELYQRTPMNETGMPADSTYTRYFDDYGSICLNIGLRHLSDRNRSTALKYFQQSSKVPGQNRVRANLYIADLLRNNISEAIKHAQLAEEEMNLLNDTDQKELLNLLTDLHRRDGNMAEARRYRELWSQL